MVKFVADRAKDPTTNQYQFGAQGMVAQLPHRLTSGVRTTTTLVEDPNLILRGVARGLQNGDTSLGAIFRGFELGTWIAIAVFATILLGTAAIISYAFTGNIWPMGILLTMTTEPILKDGDESATTAYRMHRVVVSLLGIAITVFFVVSKFIISLIPYLNILI